MDTRRERAEATWWWDQREEGRKESWEQQFVGLEIERVAPGLGRMDVESVPPEVPGLCSFCHFLLCTSTLTPGFSREVGTRDVNSGPRSNCKCFRCGSD